MVMMCLEVPMSCVLMASVTFTFLFTLTESETTTQEDILSIFGAFGYSLTCVSAALATCEVTAEANFSKDMFSDCQSIIKGSVERPRNCADLYETGDRNSGLRKVYPLVCCPNRPVTVFCDQTTDGGGWTVIQRRDALPQREDFYRTWIEYVLGFGNLTGEFWLGLDNIHALVSTTLMELRVDLEDFDGGKRWAKYGLFYVGDSNSKFTLSVSRYLGDAGDSLLRHNGFKFSTHDEDNDIMDGSCAKNHQGAWWYTKCHGSNLNGFQHERTHSSYADGINWEAYRGYNYSLKKTVMCIRPGFRNY